MQRRPTICLTLLALACAGAQPARAGFFDFLFSQQRPQQQIYVPYAPGPRYAPLPGMRDDFGEPARKKKDRDSAQASGNDQRSAEQAARNLENYRRLQDVLRDQGAKAAFLKDPTLHSGDIVVTPAGLEVFEGGGGQLHARNQFRPLASSSYRGRADLASLQKAIIPAAMMAHTPAPTAEIPSLTITGKKAARSKAPTLKKTANAALATR